MENYLTYNWQTKTLIIPIGQKTFKKVFLFFCQHIFTKENKKKNKLMSS